MSAWVVLNGSVSPGQAGSQVQINIWLAAYNRNYLCQFYWHITWLLIDIYGHLDLLISYGHTQWNCFLHPCIGYSMIIIIVTNFSWNFHIVFIGFHVYFSITNTISWVHLWKFTFSQVLRKSSEFSWQKRPVMIIIMYILLALFNKPIKYICML